MQRGNVALDRFQPTDRTDKKQIKNRKRGIHIPSEIRYRAVKRATFRSRLFSRAFFYYLFLKCNFATSVSDKIYFFICKTLAEHENIVM